MSAAGPQPRPWRAKQSGARSTASPARTKQDEVRYIASLARYTAASPRLTLMLRIVLLPTNVPQVRRHGLFAGGEVLLGDEVQLVLRDLVHILAAGSFFLFLGGFFHNICHLSCRQITIPVKSVEDAAVALLVRPQHITSFLQPFLQCFDVRSRTNYYSCHMLTFTTHSRLIQHSFTKNSGPFSKSAAKIRQN